MNKDELVVLARKLYDNGKCLSYGKIADKFNADGIKTLSGKGSWEKKMVSRLVAGDALKKAEVKVGMKSARESELESENELLRHELNTVKQRLIETIGHVNGNLSVIAKLSKCNDRLKPAISRLKKQRDRIKEEKAGLKKEVEYVRSLNDALESDNFALINERIDSFKKFQLFESELNTVKQENEYLKSENIWLRSDRDEAMKVQVNETVKTQRDCFKSEAERLNRLLTESELKFKQFYEPQITELSNALAAAKDEIEELKHKQMFVQVRHGLDIPKNFLGWTVQKRHDGKGINLFRKVSGKLKAIYVGKDWDESRVKDKIEAFYCRINSSAPIPLFSGSVESATL